MLKGNSFSQDDENERSERLGLLSANIGDYSVELGLPPDKLVWAQGASVVWEDARSLSTVESGETDEAFEEANQAYKTAVKYYSSAKEYLLSIIYELEKPDDSIKDYGFGGPGPDCVRGLIAAINAWKRCHDRQLAKVPPDTRVVPDAVITQLLDHSVIIDDLAMAARAERRERIDANAAKMALFDIDSKLLNFVFNLCKLTWNDDDSRLGLLGFVPSSEVWTPGQPAPGQAEWPEAVANFVAVFMTFPMPLFNLSWDLLLKAITYNLYRTKAPLGTPDKNRPVDPVETGLTEPLLTDTNIEQGNVYVYWICGVDENGVEGEFGEPLVMEYV